MDELEELFVSMLQEKKSEITKVLKETLLKEVVSLSYELLLQSAMNNKEMDAEDLHKKVLERLEKDDS